MNFVRLTFIEMRRALNRRRFAICQRAAYLCQERGRIQQEHIEQLYDDGWVAAA